MHVQIAEDEEEEGERWEGEIVRICAYTVGTHTYAQDIYRLGEKQKVETWMMTKHQAYTSGQSENLKSSMNTYLVSAALQRGVEIQGPRGK